MTSPPQPPPEVLVVIERTARAVAHGGLEREKLMLEMIHFIEYAPIKPDNKTLLMVERSGFLKSPNHPYHEFYRKKRDAYLAQYQDGMIHFQAPEFDDLKPPPNRDNPPPPLFKHPPQGNTLVELGLIKVTAQFVARYGIHFWLALIDMYMFPHFSFLKSSDKNFSYFNGLVALYQRLLRPHHVGLDVDKALGEFFRYLQLEKLHEKVIDLHAFAYGLDCIDNHSDLNAFLDASDFIANQDDDDIQPDAPQCAADAEPDPIPSYMFPVRISLKELGIIKLTALFVARYGQYFLRALMMTEVMNPHFDFLFFRWNPRPQFPSMEPADIRSHVFNVLVYAYSEILMPSKMANDIDHCSEVVLGDFQRRLQLKKLEKGVKSAMIDLHAFVAGVDYLAHLHQPQYSGIMSPPQRLLVMIKNQQPTLQTHPGILVLLPLGPKISDYPHISRSQCWRLEYTFPPEIRLDELGVIKLTAQFVSRYGMSFMEALMKIAPTEFEFLKLNHERRELFVAFIEVYCQILKPSTKVEKSGGHMAKALELFFRCLQLNKLKNGVAASVMELFVFMSGVEYFACMDVAGYSAITARHESHSVMMNRRLTQMDTGGGLELPTVRITLSPLEIGIIKLTALFVARYGVRICRELMKKVDMKPVLKFMEPSDENFNLYKVAVNAYSKVVEVCDDADTETVVERYFQCLEQEKGSSSDLSNDLYGFVEGVDCFAQMEDEYFSYEMRNHHLVRLYGCPCHQYDHETSKRQKVEEESASTALEEDSCRIKVCVPTVNGRKVIEIRVESWLLEKVGSLKKKIAKRIQMEAKEVKLSRKLGSGGVLKEDKSLAHNNVEAGEILILTWRFSRWT